VALVRVLLFAALGAVGVALALYAIKRDRRYLRFVSQVAKLTIFALLAILVAFAVQRIFGFSFGGIFGSDGSLPAVGASPPPPQRLPERAVG
jgi:hypothetical protein